MAVGLSSSILGCLVTLLVYSYCQRYQQQAHDATVIHPISAAPLNTSITNHINKLDKYDSVEAIKVSRLHQAAFCSSIRQSCPSHCPDVVRWGRSWAVCRTQCLVYGSTVCLSLSLHSVPHRVPGGLKCIKCCRRSLAISKQTLGAFSLWNKGVKSVHLPRRVIYLAWLPIAADLDTDASCDGRAHKHQRLP